VKHARHVGRPRSGFLKASPFFCTSSTANESPVRRFLADRIPLAPLAPRSQPWAAALLIGMYAALFLALPIHAGDTDLWYHLNSGRYFVENGALPDHSFFSFVSPPRPWVDYFWFFQLVVYGVYSAWGYAGLVVLRATVFTAALATAALLYPRDETGRPQPGLCIGITLLAFFLFSRYTLVRPHTLSYLLVLVFLWVLERRPRWRPLLPALAVFWVNVHGITYPVLYAIAGAYLAEEMWQRLRAGKKAPGVQAATLMLCFLAPLATPHGSALLRLPFVPTEFAREYINELQPIPLGHWFDFGVAGMVPDQGAAFVLLALATLAGLYQSFRSKKVRISHLLLLLAGAVLLVRGARFRYEFVLLSLPFALSEGGLPALGRFVRRSGARLVAVALFLMLANGLFVHAALVNRGAWPFDPKNLPVGVCRFLQQEARGGTLLQHPNLGGYYQWALGSRFRIYMDMEVPFLFTDEDMFLATHMIEDPKIFGLLVSQYSPRFVAIPLGAKAFQEKVLPKFRQYKPIFFDNSSVLFVDANQEPGLARKFELREVRPFDLAGRKMDQLLEGADQAGFRNEIQRVLEIHPENGLANQIMAMWMLRQKEYGKALRYADQVAAWFPASPRGHKLRGDALRGLKRFDEALEAYRQATRHSDGPVAEAAWRQMGLIYAETGDAKQAYRCFSRSIFPYRPTTNHKDLYFLGTAAFLADRLPEAYTLLRLARYKLPPGDSEWRSRVERQLRLVEAQTRKQERFP